MRHGFIKVATATPRVTVADTVSNAQSVIACIKEAQAADVKLLVLPELCLTGATCGDLFLQRTLLDGALKALEQVRAATEGSDMLVFVGLPLAREGQLYNCAAAVQDGHIRAIIPKANLEQREGRWFSSAPENEPLSFRFISDSRGKGASAKTFLYCIEIPEFRIAVEFGSDLSMFQPLSFGYADEGVTVFVNLSAEAETVSADERRRLSISAQSARLNCACIYANAGYGESTTDMVYTGHNIIAENGEILAESETLSGMVMSEIDVQRLDFERRRTGRIKASKLEWTAKAGAIYQHFSLNPTETRLTRKISPSPFIPDDEAKLAAQCEKILALQSLGLARRLEFTGVKYPVLGVSGGLDSTLAALVCARALDTLGLPRENLIAVTMPCFGTTERTKSNAERLAEALGATLRVIDIGEAVKQHFTDIGHDINKTDVVFENAQARERTQVLMDLANAYGGLVVGTGDMSELALGWATYNGDHMSMYGVNAGVPKTLIRLMLAHCAAVADSPALGEVLRAVLNTPVSPELLPPSDGDISQITEELVGPYELHDFFLYYALRCGFGPQKILRLASLAFDGVYDAGTILGWLRTFYRRFFSQQFKRSAMPDGVQIFDFGLSPRGGLAMPSDAAARLWLEELEEI